VTVGARRYGRLVGHKGLSMGYAADGEGRVRRASCGGRGGCLARGKTGGFMCAVDGGDCLRGGGRGGGGGEWDGC